MTPSDVLRVTIEIADTPFYFVFRYVLSIPIALPSNPSSTMELLRHPVSHFQRVVSHGRPSGPLHACLHESTRLECQSSGGVNLFTDDLARRIHRFRTVKSPRAHARDGFYTAIPRRESWGHLGRTPGSNAIYQYQQPLSRASLSSCDYHGQTPNPHKEGPLTPPGKPRNWTLLQPRTWDSGSVRYTDFRLLGTTDLTIVLLLAPDSRTDLDRSLRAQPPPIKDRTSLAVELRWLPLNNTTDQHSRLTSTTRTLERVYSHQSLVSRGHDCFSQNLANVSHSPTPHRIIGMVRHSFR